MARTKVFSKEDIQFMESLVALVKSWLLEMNDKESDQQERVRLMEDVRSKATALPAKLYLEALRSYDTPFVAKVMKELIKFEDYSKADKVRFNLAGETLKSLDEEVQPGMGAKSRRQALDLLLKELWDELPAAYWLETESPQPIEVLGPHRPEIAPEDEISNAFSANPLGYAFLQDLAGVLGWSQGEVLGAIVNRWTTRREQRLRDFVTRQQAADAIFAELSDGLNRLWELYPEDRHAWSAFEEMMNDAQACLQARAEGRHVGALVVPELAGSALGVGNAYLDLQYAD